jgi:hypothetical protein
VDVFDGEHEGLVAAECVEEGEERLEEPCLSGVITLGRLLCRSGWGEPGDQCPELAPSGLGEIGHYGVLLPCQRAKRRYERRVGKLALAELNAVAAYNARGWGAFARASLEFGEQACLADTGLTSYEDYGGLAAR